MSGRGGAQFTEIVQNGADPDFLYYNAMIINNSTNTTSTTNDPAITYQDTRSLPILNDKSKYAVSVENFTINGAGKNLPVMIPQIQAGNNTDPNNTVYSITFTWNSNAASSAVVQSTRFIQWEPENKASFTTQPKSPYTSPQPEIDYYYCYTYTHFLKLVNNALALAWGDVQQAVLGASVNFGTVCPFFTYDSSQNLFSLWQDSNSCLTPYGSSIGTSSDTATPANPPSPYTIFSYSTKSGYESGEYSFVGYNTNLEALLSNFTTSYYSDYAKFGGTTAGVIMNPLPTDSCVNAAANAVTGGQAYYPENVIKINVLPNLLTSDGTDQTAPVNLKSPFTTSHTSATATYYVITQDFESTSTLWSPVASIIVATTFITVREEYSGTPITIGTGNLGGNASTGSFQKVLLEVPINVDTQEGWRGLLSYDPKVETLTSLGLSKDSLKNLDIQMKWRNRLTNSLNPLLLYNGGSATTRLMFKRIHE